MLTLPKIKLKYELCNFTYYLLNTVFCKKFIYKSKNRIKKL